MDVVPVQYCMGVAIVRHHVFRTMAFKPCRYPDFTCPCITRFHDNIPDFMPKLSGNVSVLVNESNVSLKRIFTHRESKRKKMNRELIKFCRRQNDHQGHAIPQFCISLKLIPEGSFAYVVSAFPYRSVARPPTQYLRNWFLLLFPHPWNRKPPAE